MYPTPPRNKMDGITCPCIIPQILQWEFFRLDLLKFERPPKPLDKDVVQGASPAIHADGVLPVEQHTRASLGRELGTLVGIEHLRQLALRKHPFKGGHEKKASRVFDIPGRTHSGCSSRSRRTGT